MNSTAWLIIKALLVIAPYIIKAVRDGRIKRGAEDEVLSVLHKDFSQHADDADRARDDVISGRVPPPDFDKHRRD